MTDYARIVPRPSPPWISIILGVLWLSQPGRAHADVTAADSVIEAGALYAHAPTQFEGQHEPMVATGLRFAERAGVIGLLLAELIGRRGSSYCPTRVVIDGEMQCQSTATLVKETRLRRFYAYRYTPYSAADDVASRRANRPGQWNFEVELYQPALDRGNARGFATGFTVVVYGDEGPFHVEMGIGYRRMTADVCGPEAAPTPCRFHFLGVPVRAWYDLGRLGHLEVAWDANAMSFLGDETRPPGSHASPVRAGITVDVVDRLFVRAGAHASPKTITEPGFSLEAGLRL